MKEPRIIYVDKNFVAVDKPAGLLVHAVSGTRRREDPTLVEWLLSRYPEIRDVGDDPAERPGIVHRLDKETSGVLLVARRQEYFEYLKSLFANRRIKKTYRALAWGKILPPRGVIQTPIGVTRGSLKRSVHAAKFMKEAVTEYRVLRYIKSKNGEFSLLEVFPKTGRTHQVRVHLGSRGHPIVGDRLYGKKMNAHLSRELPQRLMLHASSLEFSLSQGRRIKIEAEPPEDFKKVIHFISKKSP